MAGPSALTRQARSKICSASSTFVSRCRVIFGTRAGVLGGSQQRVRFGKRSLL